MDQNFKMIKKLTFLMKKEGLLTLKTKDFELSLHPSAISLSKENTEQNKEDIKTNAYSPDDALFWSSPGLTEQEVTQ